MIKNDNIIEPFNMENNSKKVIEKPPPKKRGRKAKNKLISNVVKNEDNNFVYDNIIVNLPVQMSEISDNTEDFSKNRMVLDINNYNDTTKLFTSDNSTEENEEEEVTELKKKCLEYKSEIDKLNKMLKKIKNTDIEAGIYKMDINFMKLNGEKQEYIRKTDIHCWWCCHQFNTPPCQLPEKYFNDRFYVFGCFCSYNCALSYNIDMKDYKVNERITLLHYMYKKIYKKDINISKSLPRQSLKIFGGILTIEKFRKNLLNNDIKYNYIMPPSCSLIPLIEVDYIKRKTNILKNNKKEKNTIDNFLGLKKLSKS